MQKLSACVSSGQRTRIGAVVWSLASVEFLARRFVKPDAPLPGFFSGFWLSDSSVPTIAALTGTDVPSIDTDFPTRSVCNVWVNSAFSAISLYRGNGRVLSIIKVISKINNYISTRFTKPGVFFYFLYAKILRLKVKTF